MLRHFDRTLRHETEESCLHILTGQFLIAPVGWLPQGRPQTAKAYALASVNPGDPDQEAESESMGEEGLFFSSN